MIKIYNKEHVILDEIEDYSGLSWTKTLNGIGQAQFKIPLESLKATSENLQFMNHVEIYEEKRLVWGGIIVGRNFNGANIQIQCYGYLVLLKYRRFRAKTYTEQTYGNLFQTIINETNTFSDTGIRIGSIQTGSLNTTRIVDDTDIILDKLLDFADDVNYNFEVDDNRKFNFYLKKGAFKSNYILEYGGENDNIITAPSLTQSMLDMANSVYGKSENDGIVLTSTYDDIASQSLYGLLEGTYKANSGIVNQSTLDNYIIGELQRRAYPLYSIDLTIINTARCPFDDIDVGDIVPVNLIPYWNFRANLRVLEINYNKDNGTMKLTVGDVIYRQARPVKKLYKGGI